jgi:hypothetical protein
VSNSVFCQTHALVPEQPGDRRTPILVGSAHGGGLHAFAGLEGNVTERFDHAPRLPGQREKLKSEICGAKQQSSQRSAFSSGIQSIGIWPWAHFLAES